MQRAVHHHDSGNHVIFIVTARLAQSRDVADAHACDVLQLYGNAIGLGEDDAFDVGHIPTLGEVGRAAAVEEAHPADVDGLLTVADLTATNIDVGIANRADDL